MARYGSNRDCVLAGSVLVAAAAQLGLLVLYCEQCPAGGLGTACACLRADRAPVLSRSSEHSRG